MLGTLQNRKPLRYTVALVCGRAYEAVPKAPQTTLLTEDYDGNPTSDGAKFLLNALKKDVQDVAPPRSMGTFDTALHGNTKWRSRSESMANYVTRHRESFMKLYVHLEPADTDLPRAAAPSYLWRLDAGRQWSVPQYSANQHSPAWLYIEAKLCCHDGLQNRDSPRDDHGI